MKPKPLIFYFITYYVLQSQSSFRLILFFWGVAYTQFFFEFLKLHSEPFKYWHSVNAQLELSFLLWISLYACRWVLRPEPLLVCFRIESAFKPYGLQADDSPCQFLSEPHFPALLGYRQQVFYISPPWLASTVSCNGNIEKIRLCDSGYQIGRRCNIWSFLYHNCFLDNKMLLSFRLYG